MRKAKPEPQRASRHNHMPGEPEESFGLTEFLVGVGATRLPAPPEPSCFVVLAGCVLYTPPGLTGERRYGVGEGFCVWRAQPLTLQGPARVWRVTGRAELVWALGRFAAQLNRKDPLTAAHSARVGLLAAEMGRFLGLGSPRLEQLALAAYLHDLGKLGLPTALLQRPAPLALPEWHLLTRHPHEGKRLLEDTPLAFAGTVAEEHHERLNGSGYPAGLRGNALTLESQVVAVADTFDAITEGRPYQEPRSPQGALSEINRYGGVLFGREAVNALNAVMKRTLT